MKKLNKTWIILSGKIINKYQKTQIISHYRFVPEWVAQMYL